MEKKFISLVSKDNKCIGIVPNKVKIRGAFCFEHALSWDNIIRTPDPQFGYTYSIVRFVAKLERRGISV